MRVPRRNPVVPFESYYVPTDERASLEESHFYLEQFLSNSSHEQFAWTFFFLDVPQGSAGAVIHVQLKSDKELNYDFFCTCDRDHGGFDCSDELVSPNGHIWQSVFLIASNAAAILPAFWALRQKVSF
nr:unnamed protein product [Digitaria exilis]